MSISQYNFEWKDVDSFFEKEKTQETIKLHLIGVRKAIEEIHQEVENAFAYDLSYNMEYRVKEIITSRIIEVVRKLLLGDIEVLEEFNLAPSSWGLKCDHYGIRKKIVEDNADIIKNTYIRSLEEELARTKETVERLRDRY